MCDVNFDFRPCRNMSTKKRKTDSNNSLKRSKADKKPKKSDNAKSDNQKNPKPVNQKEPDNDSSANTTVNVTAKPLLTEAIITAIPILLASTKPSKPNNTDELWNSNHGQLVGLLKRKFDSNYSASENAEAIILSMIADEKDATTRRHRLISIMRYATSVVRDMKSSLESVSASISNAKELSDQHLLKNDKTRSQCSECDNCTDCSKCICDDGDFGVISVVCCKCSADLCAGCGFFCETCEDNWCGNCDDSIVCEKHPDNEVCVGCAKKNKSAGHCSCNRVDGVTVSTLNGVDNDSEGDDDNEGDE